MRPTMRRETRAQVQFMNQNNAQQNNNPNNLPQNNQNQAPNANQIYQEEPEMNMQGQNAEGNNPNERNPLDQNQTTIQQHFNQNRG